MTRLASSCLPTIIIQETELNMVFHFVLLAHTPNCNSFEYSHVDVRRNEEVVAVPGSTATVLELSKLPEETYEYVIHTK